MSSDESTERTRPGRRRKRRRLSDKIRAALARAAALGRRDVTEQLSTLYQATVEEKVRRARRRRAPDAARAHKLRRQREV